MASRSEDRLRRWEHATAYPLTILSVLFLVVYAWPILDPRMERHVRHGCAIADVAIWALVGVDFLIRYGLARRKRAFRVDPAVPAAAAGRCGWSTRSRS
jgi:voltage-gated potassium channel